MIKSERIEAQVRAALEGGRIDPLVDAIERVSGLPGPRPNIDMLRAVGARLADVWHDGGEDVARSLYERDRAAVVYVALMALAVRAGKSGDRGALRELVDLADETRKERRDAIADAIELVLVDAPRHAEQAVELGIEGGYLPMAVLLEAASRRTVVDKLASAEPLVRLFQAALEASNDAPRSADRSQGLRLLREVMPSALTRAMHRFSRETLEVIEPALATERPETREVVQNTLSMFRKVMSEAEVDRLRQRFEATAKPARDADRVVKGTRKRSRGR